MGSVESKQKLGERVIAARTKLEQDLKVQEERSTQLMSASPSTMQFILDRVQQSFENCSPFLENSLMMAWKANEEQCKDFVLRACKQVLSAPIKPDEFAWFKQYVLPSSLWMLSSKDGRFMYEAMMEVVEKQSVCIVQSMDSVYAHLQSHPKWNALMAIKEESEVDRQDHESVGLLRDDGIRGVADLKQSDDDLETFVDSQVAVTALTLAAKRIDREFQHYMEKVMGHFGDVKAGPMKKVERCLSKMENDYFDASYPKCAKLLDLVRCSVTFNTLEQLLVGYEALMADTADSQTCIKMARVKNGFLDQEYEGGYRDIKVNVMFQSAKKPELKMIVEVQLILGQYLNEKKRIHKLYSIAREKTYFEMVTQSSANDAVAVKDVRQLQFDQVLNVGNDVKLDKYHGRLMFKCSVESELGLLGMETKGWFGVVNIPEKKSIFEMDTRTGTSAHAHHWMTIGKQKYLLVQTEYQKIKMYKVNGHQFVEDERYQITTKGAIDYCAVDRKCANISLVVDHNEFTELELRSFSDVSKVKSSIKLMEKVNANVKANLRLSSDGGFCVLAGGFDKKYFYVVDIANCKQQKMTSTYLEDTFAPCFINDECRFISVGDHNGKIEIWDIMQREPVKCLQTDGQKKITSSASTQNVLAIGSEDKTLRLYDVRNWECFYSEQFNCEGDSLHLTKDLKYVTFAGYGGDKGECVVLQIK
uniref:Uncharacterized protein n=1 Tax=Elphidium margaritaceum TaxID=933848 RepID=A0A7S0TEL7_9EUKA|mmetsp:Transcript_2002/g.3900  ORF Transcript_2002/g.3900 Transcript_2002/m.3900 type:complete len:702 (+) Transcript_2002:85-2190(+)|eukprot:CAMPEP_0202693948 /NCGR_PEP_ID=MMETSP1385-20130828/7940_1 /ASSEMBLY_ACC=CAM_ASM_000861 /TAXON_ID=933848 /ORGANISM="Elphidium margaritaceum" /LENGTH=701 /DNA_ID=CAMNT_0049349711 /DNA_START=61 /DNA_END=2169 /DNA_ORIENTATION=-